MLNNSTINKSGADVALITNLSGISNLGLNLFKPQFTQQKTTFFEEGLESFMNKIQLS